MGDCSLEGAFRLGRRVGQWEDDGAWVPVGHLLQNLRGKDAPESGETHQDGRPHMIDDLLERLELLAFVVGPCKVDLVVGKFVPTVSSNESFGVHKVEARTGLILGHAFAHEELHDLLGHSNTGTPRAQEDGALILARDSGTLNCIDHPSEDDSAGALDVIIEAGVCMSVTLQCGEWILEILKLNDDPDSDNPLAEHALEHEGKKKKKKKDPRSTYPGQRSVKAIISSSMNSRSSSGEILS